MRGGLLIRAVRTVRTFQGGELLDVPGRPRAVHLPGHTRAAPCLFSRSRVWYFTGDALVTIDDLTGGVGPRVLCRAFTENSQQALASLDQLSRLAADLLLPGHGEPWRGAPGAVTPPARQVSPDLGPSVAVATAPNRYKGPARHGDAVPGGVTGGHVPGCRCRDGSRGGEAARAALVAVELAAAVGAPDPSDVYYTTLLQHIGCTAYAHEAAAMLGGDEIAVKRASMHTDFGDPGDVVRVYLPRLAPTASFLTQVRVAATAAVRGADIVQGV